MSDEVLGVLFFIGGLACFAFVLWTLLTVANTKRELPLSRAKVAAIVAALTGVGLVGGVIGFYLAP